MMLSLWNLIIYSKPNFYLLLILFINNVHSRTVEKELLSSIWKSDPGVKGTWRNWVYCDEGYFVNGFSIKNECVHHGVQSVNLYCVNELGVSQAYPINSFDEITTIGVTTFSSILTCSNGFINGFKFKNAINGISLNDLQFSCQNEVESVGIATVPYYVPTYKYSPPLCNYGTETSFLYCDTMTSVCGIQIRYIEELFGAEGITDIKLACCLNSCKPSARMYYNSVTKICEYCHKYCKTCNGPTSNDCLSCDATFTKSGSTCTPPTYYREFVDTFHGSPIDSLELTSTTGSFTQNAWKSQDSIITNQKSTCSSNYYILGGYLRCGSGCYFSKKVLGLIPHYAVRIMVRYFKIDFWDNNESLLLILDGDVLPLPIGSFFKWYNDFYSIGNLCGNSNYPEDIYFLDITTDHTSTTLVEIKFSSTLDDSSSSESFGIRDVTLALLVCDYSCATCNGPNSDNCQTCYAGATMVGTSCVCPTTNYFNKIKPNCAVTPCSICTACNAACTGSCYGTLSTNCCHSSCKTCTGSLLTQCNSCFIGFYFNSFDNTCVSACPAPYWSSSLKSVCVDGCYINEFGDINDNRKCKSCSTTCRYCVDFATKCTECISSKYLENNLCVNSCTPPNYAYSYLSSKACFLQCPDMTYINEGDKTCYKDCPSYKFGNPITRTCEDSCEIGRFLYSLYYRCDLCTFDCISCSDSYHCDTCKYLWPVNSGYCTKPLNYYNVQNYFTSYTFLETDISSSGWVIGGADGSTYKTKCYSIYDMVGGYGVFGKNAYMQNIISNLPPHYKARLTFAFIKIDNWNNNKLLVLIDGSQIYEQSFTATQDSVVTKYCGDSTNDALRFIDINFIHELTTLTIKITTDLTVVSTIASWGVYKMSINVFRCHETCKTCSDSLITDCKSCYNNGHLDSGKCVCDDHYYQTQVSAHSCTSPICSTCNICDSTCFRCSAGLSTNCLDCQLPRFFYSGQCLLSCISPTVGVKSSISCESSCSSTKTYIDSNRICQDCHSSCLTCNGPLETDCLSCEINTFLNIPPAPNKCTPNCNEGWMPDVSDQKCKQCSAPCKNCIDIITKCTSCTTGFLNGNICEITCTDPKWGFLTSKTCENSCLVNQFQKIDDKICYDTCPDPFFGVKSASKCESNCPNNEFADDIDKICYLKCPDPNHGNPLNKKCESNCPARMFVDVTDNICKLCDSSCFKCSGPAQNECTQCELSLFLYQNQCLDNCAFPTMGVTSSLICENNCLSKKYYLDSLRICRDCHISCEECVGPSENECSKCSTGTFLNIVSNSIKKCLNSCPPGSIQNTNDHTCGGCDNNCKTCEGGTKFDCRSCYDGKFLFTASNIDSQCLLECPKGSFPENSICRKCAIGCEECTSLNLCKSCRNSFFYFNFTCFDKCPESTNTYADLNSFKCVFNCDIGYYKNDTIKICSKCINNCNSCSAADYCLSCNTPYLLQNNTCLPNCFENYFPTLDGICTKDCIKNCLKCVNYQDCLECDNSTYLSEKNLCVNCDNPNEIKYGKKCIKCPIGCEICTSVGKCDKCIDLYEFNDKLECIQIVKVFANLKKGISPENIVLEFTENSNLIFKNTSSIVENLNIEGLEQNNYKYNIEISSSSLKIYNILFSFKKSIKNETPITITFNESNFASPIYLLQNKKIQTLLQEFIYCNSSFKYVSNINKCLELTEITPILSLTSFSNIILLSFTNGFGSFFEQNIKNSIVIVDGYNNSYYNYSIIKLISNSDEFEIRLSFKGSISNNPLFSLYIKMDLTTFLNETYLYVLTKDYVSINLKNYDGTSLQLLENTAKTTEIMNTFTGSETITATNFASSGASFAIRALMCMDMIKMLRFFEINYPEIVVTIFESKIQITNIVPDFKYIEENKDLEASKMPFIFKRFGMSIYIVNNVGCIICENLIYVCFGVCIIFLAKIFKKINNSILNFITRILESVLVWNFPLSYFMSSFLEYSFASFLSLKFYSLQSEFAIFNFLLALTLFISTIISFLLIFKKVRGIRNFKRMETVYKSIDNKIQPITAQTRLGGESIIKINKFEKEISKNIDKKGNQINDNFKTEGYSATFHKSSADSPESRILGKEDENSNKYFLEYNSNELRDDSLCPVNPPLSGSSKTPQFQRVFTLNDNLPLNEKEIEQKKNELDKFLILFNDFNQNSRWQGYFLIFDLGKQLLFCFVFVNCHDKPITGLIILCFTNLMFALIFLLKKPFNNKSDTIQTFINEFFLNISFFSALILAFCDYFKNNDLQTRISLGWVIVTANFCLIGFFIIRFFYLICTLLIKILNILKSYIKLKIKQRIEQSKRLKGRNQTINRNRVAAEDKIIHIQNIIFNNN